MSDFDVLKKLASCLLSYHKSCEGMHLVKDFVKIAVDGRHRKIGCIFVEHNLCPSKQVVTHYRSQYNTHCFSQNTTRRAIGSTYSTTVEEGRLFPKFMLKSDYLAIRHLMVDLDPELVTRFASVPILLGLIQPLFTVYFGKRKTADK